MFSCHIMGAIYVSSLPEYFMENLIYFHYVR